MKLRDLALKFGFVWVCVGVAGFYLGNGGWHGAIYQAFQMTGGRWEINAGVVALLLLGFVAILVAAISRNA